VVGVIWLVLVVGVAALIVSLLTKKRFISRLLVLGILGGCVALESSAIVETHKFNLMIESMSNLRDVGLKIFEETNSPSGGLPAELPPGIVADRGFRDGWGHPLRYVRISPNRAYLIAPGSDGRIEANPEAIKRETFPPSRFEHEIIFEIAAQEPRFVVYPDGPEQGTACTTPSVFGCLQYWRCDANRSFDPRLLHSPQQFVGIVRTELVSATP
jgi:hypothetical protein